MNITGKSDKGLMRSANEDIFYVAKLNNDCSVAIVCDGMGGARSGNIASRMACDIISQRVTSLFSSERDINSIRNILITALSAANAEIFYKSQSDENYYGMGTTVVAAVVSNNLAQIVHVGDSRAYKITSEELLSITTDHSVVQEMIENGEISEKDAREHPQKNLITRAVGVDKSVDIDYDEICLSKGDKIMLCTDGLTNMCDNETLFNIISSNSISTVCDALINAANEHGGADNITVAFIEI